MSMKRFSPTKDITKENLESIPTDKPGVYRIKNCRGKIIYIGKARSKLMEAIANRSSIAHYAILSKFQYRLVDSLEEAERIERKEIRRWTPPRNNIERRTNRL